MLIDKQKYKDSLSLLWHRVFGDDYSYISILFKEDYGKSILCFGELDNEDVISAFYLLKNTLNFNGKIYNGFYLYAAATLPEYRGKGTMSALIREAQDFCKAEGYDCISLLPAEESLYDYYGRFGFETAMYRCSSQRENPCKAPVAPEYIDNPIDILSLRKKYEGNMLSFDDAAFSYATECLKATGYRFCRLSSDSYVLLSEEEGNVIEFISPIKTLDTNRKLLLNSVSCKVIDSPFELELCAHSLKQKSGMIFPINGELCRKWNYTDIYMNIALD